jgi:hypothetical protein
VSRETGALAFSADGQILCGHPQYIAAKSTCTEQVYLDIRPPSSAGRDAIDTCFIENGIAIPVRTAVKDLHRLGRMTVPTMHEVRLDFCNRSLSPDHRLLGIATARDANEDFDGHASSTEHTWVDGELDLVDIGTGGVVLRQPIGKSRSDMGAFLSIGFFPTGRFVQVYFGTEKYFF